MPKTAPTGFYYLILLMIYYHLCCTLLVSQTSVEGLSQIHEHQKEGITGSCLRICLPQSGLWTPGTCFLCTEYIQCTHLQSGLQEAETCLPRIYCHRVVGFHLPYFFFIQPHIPITNNLSLNQPTNFSTYFKHNKAIYAIGQLRS